MPKYDIIFFAVEPYEHYTPHRRRHHVAWRLAKDNRVLWISPPVVSIGLFFPRHYNLTHYLFRSFFDLGQLKYQGRNLWVYCPVQIFPTWHKIPIIAKINKLLVFQALQRAVKKMNFCNPILWLYKNRCDYEYYGLFNEKMIIYDSYDIQTAFQGFGQGDAWLSSVIAWEVRAIRKANIVFAVSQGLYNDAREINENAYLIPNGVDYDSFQSSPSVTSLPRLKHIKKPILGYLGILHNKIDFDLLNYVAESRPDWSILLMGRDCMKIVEDRRRFSVLSEKKNVHYIGEITREEIPGYLQHTDACLMPMKKTEFNRYTNPLKLWEYLAAGKPVVVVDQGVKYQCQHLIMAAYNKEDFVCCIEEALREDSPELVAKRKRLARENSWDRRVDKMMELIEADLHRHVH